MILINDDTDGDVFIPEDIFEEIAENVLSNLKNRGVIGRFEGESQMYVEIVEEAASTIHKGITEFVDVNYFKGDETANMKILSVSEARTELKNLFQRNLDNAATS